MLLQTSDCEDKESYTFLTSGCRSGEENSKSLKIYENGSSPQVRFSITAFAFKKSPKKSIFLHCLVRIKYQGNTGRTYQKFFPYRLRVLEVGQVELGQNLVC